MSRSIFVSKNRKYKGYYGKHILYENKLLRKYANDLRNHSGEVQRKIFDILTEKSKKEIICEINRDELGWEYKKYLCSKNKRNIALLLMTSDAVRHLALRGHLTGLAKRKENDPAPINNYEISYIRDVFTKPDLVLRNGSKMKFTREIDGNIFVLVTTYSASKPDYYIVTFFRKNKNENKP